MAENIREYYFTTQKRTCIFLKTSFFMNNNNHTFRIVLAAAIVIAFFLPWFKYGGGSGLDIVMTKSYQEETATTLIRYSFLLIPLFALIVMIRSINKRSSNFLLRLLPFLVTAILTTLFILGVKYEGATNEQMRGLLQILSYGIYINGVASLLLVFV
jgi:hypothetical protein